MNFDAESNDTLVYKNEKCYKTIANGYPLNSFAMRVCNNRLQFPTIAVLDEQMNHLDALNAFFNPDMLKPVLKYYAEDKFKIMNWQDYINTQNNPKK